MNGFDVSSNELFDKIMAAPDEHISEILSNAGPFLELKLHDGMPFVSALKSNLLEIRFLHDKEEENVLLYIVFANREKTLFRIEKRSLDDILDEIQNNLAVTLHNLTLLLDQINFYDDYDAYSDLAEFWELMNKEQQEEYVKSSFRIWGTPDFLLDVPEVFDSFNFKTLLLYMNDWSGGGRIQVLEKLARIYWEKMSEEQKSLWAKRCKDWNMDGEELINLH